MNDHDDPITYMNCRIYNEKHAAYVMDKLHRFIINTKIGQIILGALYRETPYEAEKLRLNTSVEAETPLHDAACVWPKDVECEFRYKVRRSREVLDEIYPRDVVAYQKQEALCGPIGTRFTMEYIKEVALKIAQQAKAAGISREAFRSHVTAAFEARKPAHDAECHVENCEFQIGYEMQLAAIDEVYGKDASEMTADEIVALAKKANLQ